MGRVSTALKALLTAIILGGLLAAYIFVGDRFEIGPFFGIPGLILWIGVITSVLIFIWGALPRWLVLLSWTVLVVYLTFLVSTEPPTAFQVYLALVLFGLFLIFLGKWIRDVRTVRRLVRELDATTLKELQRIQGTVPGATKPGAVPGEEAMPRVREGTPKPAQPESPAAAVQLDPTTVKTLRDLSRIIRRLESERQDEEERDRHAGYLEDMIREIRAFEQRLAARSLRSSKRETVVSVALFVVGSALGFSQPIIQAWILGMLGIPAS